MIERFQKIMEYAGVSPKRFAEILGIERSNVSHIMSGRNNPSLAVVQKILKNFPDISSDWLLFGDGNMLKANATGSTLSTPVNTAAASGTNVGAPQVNAPSPTPSQQLQNANVQPADTKPFAPTATASTVANSNNYAATASMPTAATPTAAPIRDAAPEPPRTKVDKQEPKKNVEYQTIAPISTDTNTNVQPTSAQIQSMLANGLIVLDHSTKTFTVYTQGN